MAQIQDRIYMDKEDKELYEKLDEEEMLRHKGGNRTRKEQFLFAMAVGFEKGTKRELEKREGLFNLKDLKLEDEILINAVAISETKSISIISQKNNVYKIAEEYAHAGIKLLVNEIQSCEFGSFEKFYEKKLKEIYSKLDI
jgi:dnd system-associated protein 4